MSKLLALQICPIVIPSLQRKSQLSFPFHRGPSVKSDNFKSNLPDQGSSDYLFDCDTVAQECYGVIHIHD